MKKTSSISFTVLATLILFTLSIFPHHHHEGIPCMRNKLCQSRHVALLNTNQSHSDSPEQEHIAITGAASDPEHEHSTSHDSGHGHCCTAEQPYIHSQTDTRVKHSISYRDFFPLHFLVATLTADIAQPSFTRFKNEYIPPLFYRSADVNRLNGLRAPPYPLS